MAQMPPITGQAALNILQIDLPGRVLPSKQFQSPLKAPLVAGSKLPDHLSCLCRIKVPSYIIHSLSHRKQLRLLIEFQLQLPVRVLPDLLKALFQHFVM